MGAVDPAVAAVRSAVRRDLAALGPAPGDLVLVACSGGSDSSALAAALAHEAPRVGRSVRSRAAGVRAGAVVVDHGLQAGSGAVAAAAAERCRALGLDPVLVRRVAVGREGGVEAAARTARYAAFEEAVAATGAAAVLLGHTRDDQAEQVLLGLGRGSGARSLAGMPRVRGHYRRPLLDVSRAETRAACAAERLVWWDDPTNALPAVPASGTPSGVPLRTRVRHEVLPLLEEVLGPGAVRALARSADQLRADADALDALAADLVARAAAAAAGVRGQDADGVGEPSSGACGGASGGSGPALVLDVALLGRAPSAVRRRALRLAALDVGAPAGATGSRHVDALDALVVGWRGQGVTFLPSGASAHRAYGRLFLHPGPDGAPSRQTLSSTSSSTFSSTSSSTSRRTSSHTPEE
ncbi:tRNA lysidine(34) synthetase TilS [Xylanimonas allomyrinae]|uniref:tRNA(Ile)-lysidine synthase n=1 Tax=Xylanimonas allomyrinae TaxID=2509459 RepID=A0A4P6EPF7_9MICO|nr:tRNA lysidine(34) synthetase TilS [Xylanimonas allomyrinae]QAY63673.1 tRNA lysidine(34) synthetase TilS [Xylanimonas allomyrinae]